MKMCCWLCLYSFYRETLCSSGQASACLPKNLGAHKHAIEATILIPKWIYFAPVHQPCSSRRSCNPYGHIVDKDHTTPQGASQINDFCCCLNLQVISGSFASQDCTCVHRDGRALTAPSKHNWFLAQSFSPRLEPMELNSEQHS